VVAINGEKHLATDPTGKLADGIAVGERESCLDHVLSSNTVTAHEASLSSVASDYPEHPAFLDQTRIIVVVVNDVDMLTYIN
jgi:hypothetical protein